LNKRIDLTAIDTQITPIIHAVQYDTDRYIDCYFEDIDITGVSSARIYGLKPDGTEVYNDCVINDGYITAPLTSQTLAVVGTVKCQLQLVIDGTLTSFEFSVIVDKSLVSASAIPSSNEYTALEAALAEVEDVITGLPAKEDKANKVTELSADSTDIEYPSAKCVYDAISGIQPITVDDALSPTSTNPVQNKVIYQQFDDFAQGLPSLFEALVNKVTSIDEDSTDVQYPSAKCVYDLLVAIQSYIDTELAKKFNLTGGTISGAVTLNGALSMGGNLNMGNRQINNLAAPAYPNSATRKQYVDDAIAAALIVDTEEVIP